MVHFWPLSKGMGEENTGHGEQRPLRMADLARHWNVTSAYITKLVKTNGLPLTADGKVAFLSLEDADLWRAVNAPPRRAKSESPPPAPSVDSMENLDGATEKIAPPNPTTTTTEQNAAPAAGGGETARGAAGGEKSLPANKRQPEAEIIDVTRFIRRDVDFDALMIQQAEGVPQVAHGLYERACAIGSANEIAAHLRNWHESSKAAGAVREKFLEIQERTRALLPLDEVMDVVGMELQQARSLMIKMGERIAAAANPQDPALARRVIEAAVDGVFRQYDSTLTRAAKELAG